jgi:hypothetical protein
MIQEEFMHSLLIPKRASRKGFRLGTDGEAQLLGSLHGQQNRDLKWFETWSDQVQNDQSHDKVLANTICIKNDILHPARE